MRAARLVIGACGVAMLCVAAAILVSTALAIDGARFAGPVGDFWRFLPFLEAFEGGEAVWPYLWEIHGGHRLVVPRIFYLAEYEWFQGRNLFLLGASFVLQALAASLLSSVVWRACGRLGRGATGFAIGFVWVAAFSATQIDNFVRPWNLHQFLPPAAVALSLSCWAQSASGAGRTAAGWLVASIAAASVASLSMANGLLVWPVLAGMSFAAGRNRGAMALAAGSGVAVGIYLIGFPVGNAQAPRLAQALDGLLLLLGTPWSWSSEAAGRTVGALGIAAGIALGVLHLRERGDRNRSPWDAIPIGLCTFYGASLLMTMLFRSHQIFKEAWSTPHYQTLVLAYWSALLVAAWLRLPGATPRAQALRAGIAVAGLAWVLGVLLPAGRIESERVGEIGAEARRANLAIVAGVPSRDEYLSVLPWGDLRKRRDTLAAHRDFLERRGLGPFAGSAARWIHAGNAGEIERAAAEGCEGSIDEILVTGAPRWLRIEGRAWDVGARAPVRHLLVEDGEGRIVGVGRARRRAPIVGADEAERSWVIYSRSKPRLVVSGVLEDGSLCELGRLDRRSSG